MASLFFCGFEGLQQSLPASVFSKRMLISPFFLLFYAKIDQKCSQNGRARFRDLKSQRCIANLFACSILSRSWFENTSQDILFFFFFCRPTATQKERQFGLFLSASKKIIQVTHKVGFLARLGVHS